LEGDGACGMRRRAHDVGVKGWDEGEEDIKEGRTIPMEMLLKDAR
jgi:hypothetical protein